jgi:hypothetical protein
MVFSRYRRYNTINTTVRFMEEDDIPSIILMFERWHLQCKYKEASFNEKKVDKWLRSVVDGDKTKEVLLVWDYEGHPSGVLCGLATALPFSEDVVCAEYFWYIEEGFRQFGGAKLLWEAYEYWATNVVKAKGIQMAALDGMKEKALERVYKRKGYEPVERSYIKWL